MFPGLSCIQFPPERDVVSSWTTRAPVAPGSVAESPPPPPGRAAVPRKGCAPAPSTRVLSCSLPGSPARPSPSSGQALPGCPSPACSPAVTPLLWAPPGRRHVRAVQDRVHLVCPVWSQPGASSVLRRVPAEEINGVTRCRGHRTAGSTDVSQQNLSSRFPPLIISYAGQAPLCPLCGKPSATASARLFLPGEPAPAPKRRGCPFPRVGQTDPRCRGTSPLLTSRVLLPSPRQELFLSGSSFWKGPSHFGCHQVLSSKQALVPQRGTLHHWRDPSGLVRVHSGTTGACAGSPARPGPAPSVQAELCGCL